MLVKISNLGPIKKAELLLGKKMTVLCGVNNTGKTYVSYLLYYLFSENQSFMLRPFARIHFGDNTSYQLSREIVDQWLDSFSTYIKSNISSIFGISNSQAQELLGDFSMSMSISDSEFEGIVSNAFKQGVRFNHNEMTIQKRKRSRVFHFSVVSLNSQALKVDMDSLLSVSMNMVFKRMLLGSYRSFMFTVERNSIYTFKTELSITRNELLNKIIEASDGNTPTPIEANRYPVAIFDSLRYANDIVNISKKHGHFYELATKIETDLLLGKVITSDRGDISLMVGKDIIPIHITSSIVKTLSSFVLYLKHMAYPGDSVFIDEPEMNFHPYNQILITRLFSLLSNKGIHFIISTHSDYVIRELNNLVMAGELMGENEQYVKGIGYESEQVLEKDDMAVYNFIRHGDGVYVNPVEVTETGFPVDSIDNAIERQNADTELLFGKLMEKAKY